MKVLIIEDEKELGNSIKIYLQAEDLFCDIALDTQMAKELQETNLYDFIILDIMLPQQSGLSYLTELSKNETKSKIIVISAKNSDSDRVQVLNLGAIAYLVKPFHLATLNAIIKELLIKDNAITIGNFQIYKSTNQVIIENEITELSNIEMNILFFLILNRNKVVSKNAIAEHMNLNSTSYFSNFSAIENNKENLLKKLPLLEQHIKQIHNIAYKLI